MQKVRTVVIAILLASAMVACSRCEMPDLVPKFCKSGPATNFSPLWSAAGNELLRHGGGAEVVEVDMIATGKADETLRLVGELE
jgi:hypothetical protein